jgi:hypothetical protein
MLRSLQALVDELGAQEVAIPDPGSRPSPARGAITPEGLARDVRKLVIDRCSYQADSGSWAYDAGISKLAPRSRRARLTFSFSFGTRSNNRHMILM